MKHPILRPGYVPIPVFHEGAEVRQQQHPCYSYIQPSAAQSIRTDGCTPSPTLGIHGRPRSPLHGPSECCPTETAKCASPVSYTPEVYTAPHHPLSRTGSTGLQAGYIPIPVIHEGSGGGAQTQPQLNPSVYSQRVPFTEHQQPFRLQTEDWPGYAPRERASPTMFPQHRDASSIHLPTHMRSQSPIVTQVLGDRPQVQQHILMREPPPQKMEQEPPSPQQKPEFVQSPLPLHTDVEKPQQPQHFQPPPPQQPQSVQQVPPTQQPASPQTPQPEPLHQAQQQLPPRQDAQPSQHTADITVQLPHKPEAQNTATPPAPPLPEAPKVEPVHPGLAKVEQIIERVAKLEQEVKCFYGKKNDKKYLLLEELLTKELLALDSVDPEGRVDVRQARRDGVRRVQTILDKLEQMEEQLPVQQTSETSTDLTPKGEPTMFTNQNKETSKEIS